ncbi:uncharacterized protein BT62DRAFT_1004333 [Guyanagaster necrorhizus]|uniref:Uncharacterized protein n=1 Tax=Guyanagaster necrorhizus TaxID=856835 RepID=A0A9P8AU19_9AGAR|nr:uncharacterized protein BT62DRAFT_1004333 [Guyanagaster necrorhizus MCA 3950]KAG7447576.1 hypothetical protein BT62DRAFT_1004333 [Guyanagaster necrorhizus MCA 3950]
MLLDLSRRVCEVMSGVAHIPSSRRQNTSKADPLNPKHLVEAYVDSGEGVDRACGFAIQGLGGLLI